MKRNISDLEMGGESEINLSPMIDCIFILLIFFIVTTVFVRLLYRKIVSLLQLLKLAESFMAVKRSPWRESAQSCTGSWQSKTLP